MHRRWTVVLTLLESKRRTGKKRLFGVGFASLAIHSAMIVGVVYATLHAAPREDQVRMDTMVVLLVPQEQQKPVEPPPVQLADAIKGFQTVAVPVQIPTDIPLVDLQQRFDPKDYSGSGVEGGRASGIVVSGNEVYAEALVEERPALLSAPPPVYPAHLRQAGIQGRVILPAVIDTTGRVEPASVRIMKSPNPEFDQPTKDWVQKALFRPARLGGRSVRVFINLLVDYSITRSSGSYSITTWSDSP
jgi:TonB family protein